jgi:hypothetical protein
MKKFYLVSFLVLFAFFLSDAQVTIWSEDFPYSNGTTQGSGTPPKWTRDVSGCNFGSGDHFEVRNNRMQGRDTDGEAIWYSESIDISAYSNVRISMDLSETGGMEANDYIRVYYNLDGGGETLFETNGDMSDDFTSAVASQTGLNGNSVVIVVKVNNNANNERHRFDNVLVVEPLFQNDDCTGAIAIGEVTDLPFSTIGATASGLNPGCGGGDDPIDIWFAYSPSSDGFAEVDLCGSTYDTRLAVWDACGGNLLLCNDDDDYCGSGSLQSYLSGYVTAGITYYIQVGGYNTDVGDGDITITLTPAPSNDYCMNAIPIGEVTDLPFSTMAATQSGENPGCGGGTDPVDIWFEYTPSASGVAMFDLCGSSFNTRLAIWDACGGSVLDCNLNNGPACSGLQSSIEMEVDAGTVYYVQIGGRNAIKGDGDLTISLSPFPENDYCADATPINEVTDLPFTTTMAHVSGQDPGCGGATPVDIWYAYTPTVTGIALFDLCGSDFDTRLAIWDACGGSVLACNDDDDYCDAGSLQSYITMEVTEGVVYFVQVGGYDTDIGDGDLTISVVPEGTNDDCANATPINEVTDFPFTTIGATQSGENPGCGGTDPIDIWFAYTPTVSGTATIDLCGSGFDTRLAVWDACGGNVLDCNDDDGPVCSGTNASIEMEVTLGATYYIQVGGYETDTGNGDLTISVASGDQNALEFDGVDDYVGVGDTPDINTGGPYPDRTIEAWFYCEDVNKSTHQVIWEEGGGSRGFNIYLYNGALYVGGWNRNETGWTGSWPSTSNVSSQRWHHVTLRLENGNDNVEPDKIKGFLDGIEFGSLPASQVYSHPGNINIGRSDGTKFHNQNNAPTGFYFEGIIDEVRIWNEARTIVEIRNDMHREIPLPDSETNLVAYYKFNQSAGNNVPDNSSYGNSGTRHNMDDTDWITSTAPIPYNSVQDGNWDTDATWDIGQMAPVNDWARVSVNDNVNLNQDQTLLSLIIFNSGSLTVNAGQHLTMDGTLSNLSGTGGLVLSADATGMASLIHNTNGVEATVEQYLTSERWHYVSSPVSNADISVYLDIYLKEYDEPTAAWNYLVLPTTLPMDPGKGYAAWASDDLTGTTTVEFQGYLNNGDITLYPEYTPSSPNPGFNFVGNPYPSYLDWNSNWTTTNIGPIAYFYDGTQYVNWNSSTNSGTATSGNIPPTQGFFVQASGASPALTLPQSERIHSSQGFYKEAYGYSSLITLNIAGNGYSDKIIIGSADGATNDFDIDFDAIDIIGFDKAPQMYVISPVRNLSVDIVAALDEERIIPVGIEVGESGIYSIKVEDMEGFESKIILEDIKENTFVELDRNDTYSFNADINDDPHRFNIHFKAGATGVEDSMNSSVSIYSFEDIVYINKPVDLTGDVTIINMMGQEVVKTGATSGTIMNIKVTEGSGYYLVKLQSGNQLITQKVFIR